MKITISAPSGSITARAMSIILALHPNLTAEDVASEVFEEFLEQGLDGSTFLKETGQAVSERIQRKRRRARRAQRTGKAARR